MPGFDRRGPEGMGPLTGRRMGYCAGAETSSGRGMNSGRGGGFGRGFGGGFGGRGMGFRNGFGRGAYPAPIGYYGADRYESTYPREDELKMLQEESAFMAARIKEIDTRISELDVKADKKKE